ncbi:RNF126 [Scenedesmus sp. PABB004]|nr:RNF126 [Scenedesmus sp. PABB004]
MWAPILAVVCILTILGILLSLPFIITRARRVPVLDRALNRVALLLGAPWPVPTHCTVRQPLSKVGMRSLPVTHYRGQPADAAPRDVEACPAFDDEQELESCPICFGEYAEGQAIIKLMCNHFFHKECILRWLKRDATCPLCKADLAAHLTGASPSPSSHASSRIGAASAGGAAAASSGAASATSSDGGCKLGCSACSGDDGAAAAAVGAAAAAGSSAAAAQAQPPAPAR